MGSGDDRRALVKLVIQLGQVVEATTLGAYGLDDPEGWERVELRIPQLTVRQLRLAYPLLHRLVMGYAATPLGTVANVRKHFEAEGAPKVHARNTPAPKATAEQTASLVPGSRVIRGGTVEQVHMTADGGPRAHVRWHGEPRQRTWVPLAHLLPDPEAAT